MSILYRYTCDNPKCRKHYKALDYMIPLSRYDEEVKCPECKKPLRRLLNAPPFKIN
jgi:predicted nucleic acid-binding Zn ribbon protein